MASVSFFRTAKTVSQVFLLSLSIYFPNFSTAPPKAVMNQDMTMLKSDEKKSIIFEETKLPTGELVVVTASPNPLSSKGGMTISGPGRKGALGLEDPGIYEIGRASCRERV
jgi:hypothetical protein